MHSTPHQSHAHLAAAFAGVWPLDRAPYCGAAPGHVDVLGGLGAQGGGVVVHMPLNRWAHVGIALRTDHHLVAHSRQIRPPLGQSPGTLDLAGLPLTTQAWPAYLAGTLDTTLDWLRPLVGLWGELYRGGWLRTRDQPPPGADIYIDCALPMQAGQGASTALLIALLRALAQTPGFALAPAAWPDLIQQVEALYSVGGVHAVHAQTCLHALPGTTQWLRLSGQPPYPVDRHHLPTDLQVLALDTGVRYSSAHESVRELRLAGALGLRIVETIYRDLGLRTAPLRGYLANLSPTLYRQYFRALMPRRLRGADFSRSYGALPEPYQSQLHPEQLYRVRAAVDHMMSESDLASQLAQAWEELSRPDLTAPERESLKYRAGRVLMASQHSYRLRLGLSCREADWLVGTLTQLGPKAGIYGLRLTGSGGGGTLVALCNRTPRAMDGILDTITAYRRDMGLVLDVIEAG